MPIAENLIAFTLAAALLTLTPGIDTALVLRTTAVEGRRQALRAALGINAGCLLWGAAVAIGRGARLAVSVVVNFEEGAEFAVSDGDPQAEKISEVVSVVPPGRWDQGNEQIFAYGMRAGIWRMLAALEKHRVPATFYMCGRAVERLPQLARRIVEAGHEAAALTSFFKLEIPPLFGVISALVAAFIFGVLPLAVAGNFMDAMTRLRVSARQMSPRPCRAMKLIASGVAI